MKIINKFLIIFMVLAVVSGSSVLAFNDTEGTNYSDEASLLSALGILNGYSADEFGGEKPLTRAEFSAVLIRMLGYSEDALEIPEKPVYTDVSLEHWAIKSIYKAYLLGIMTGKGDGSFAPEENVLYTEAIKVMVNALGYEEIALAKGGYPAGYNSVAASQNITNGTSASYDGTVTRGNLAKLIYNTLNGYCLNVYGFENGNAISSKDKTLMETALKIYYAEGVIRAYGDVSVNDAYNSCPEGRFLLEDALIYTGDTDPSECIGKNVGVYYKKDAKGSSATAVYIWDTQKENITKEIDGKLISKDTTLTRLVYKKNADTTSTQYLTISDDAVFMYNNKLLNVKKAEDLHIKNGNIRLIDNDRDNKYDVVFINEYETYVVDSVVGTTVSINTKFGKDVLQLDSDKKDISVKYYLNGEEVDFSSVSAKNVLSVLKSKNIDGTVIYRIYISNTSAEGEITEIKTKDDTYIVKFSEEEGYELADDYMERINAGEADSKMPEAGKAYTVYLDVFGKIVYMTESDTVKNYGYLIYAKIFSSDLADTAKFRIFTKNGEFIDFNAKDKMLFNNSSVSSSEVVSYFTKKNGDTADQLVVYKTNTSDEITEMMTAEDKTGDNTYIGGNDEFVLNHEQAGGLRFYKNLAENNPYIFKASKSIQFMIPADRTREKDYKIVTKLSGTDISMPGALKIYDVGKGGIIGAVVSGTSATGKFSAPAIVDYIADAVNEDGEPCKRIYFVGGSSVAFNEDDVAFDELKSDSKGSLNWPSRVDYSDVKLSELEKGDVIKYKLSDSNMLATVAILLRVSDMGLNRIDGDHIAESGNMIGDVISVSDDRNTAVLYTVDRDGIERYQTMYINGTAYRYSTDDKEVYYSSKNEVEVGDKLLINSYWWSCIMVYIIR